MLTIGRYIEVLEVFVLKRYYVSPSTGAEFRDDSLGKRRNTGRNHILEIIYCHFGKRLQASKMKRTKHMISKRESITLLRFADDILVHSEVKY